MMRPLNLIRSLRRAEPAASDPALRTTLWILGGLTILRLVWLSGQPIDLYPDEAQYWIWSRHPDWGYFSKPPMVTWMIWVTTQLLGDSDLVVKATSTLTYFFTSLVVYGIGSKLYDRHTGGWAAIAFMTLPAVSLSAVVISTDVPLLFFWAVATYALIRAREPDGRRWWIVVGLAGGLGLLSKYAMGFWLGSALLFIAARPAERRHLPAFLAAALLAFILYLPNFVWNATHGFASYRHTAANANLHGFTLHPQAFLEFFGSQFGVFGPVFLMTLGLILWKLRRLKPDPATALLVTLSVPTLFVMICESMLSRAQPNWSAPAYVTATVLVVAWLQQQGRDGFVQWSVVGHLMLAILGFSAHDIGNALGYPVPVKLDPAHRLRGWHTLGQALSILRIQAPDLPLLGDDRETMAGLIYYMHPHPFDMRIWNPGKLVNSGFDMTQSLPDRPGGDYLWLTTRDNPADVLARFTRHDEIGRVSVPLGAGEVRAVTAWAVYGFKGYGDPSPKSP